MPTKRLWRRLDEAKGANTSYKKGDIIGFPGTAPHRLATGALMRVAEEHPNNIGVHTLAKRTEMGFLGTQEIERELIYTLASLVGADHPEAQVDGYVCAGGTEGNDHGMWLGREMLFAKRPCDKEGVAVLTSCLAHYSIDKGFQRLFFDYGKLGVHCLKKLPTNENGELDASIVERAIRFLRQVAHDGKNGYRKFLIILTAGTINMGSVDRVPEICAVAEKLEQELGIVVHVHVDAAFGGFVLPFLDPPDTSFGLGNSKVTSISLDVHKMGYGPYSSGVFLCRKGLIEKYTNTKATYLAGDEDYTVCGSRSGATAAAAWAVVKGLGHKGYSNALHRCLGMREHLRKRLDEFNDPGNFRVTFYPTRVNILTVRCDEALEAALESIRSRFCIPTDKFPRDLTRYDDKATLDRSNSVKVFRFVAMPHVTRGQIDRFITALRKASLSGTAR